MKILSLLCLTPLLWSAAAARETVALPGKSPLVTVKVVFRAGSALDPADKPGVASLLADMISAGGSKNRTYKQIVDALYPMAVHVESQVDKEMTTFTATTHADNLDAFYALFREMLLEPGWRPEDLTRLRDSHTNALRVSLRGNNDEELGKEVLYSRLFAGHPYRNPNLGTASGLAAIQMEDLQKFYKAHYNQANLIFGIAGGYPREFQQRMEKDLGTLPAGKRSEWKAPDPKPLDANHVTVVDKQTRSVAFSFGHPIDVRRGEPDFPALLLAQAYFGQHRNSTGVLYQHMRENRGLNYGDYAYIEYFPNGMFQFEPDPNLVRSRQIFQIWIRPVEAPTAHFALRLALFELQKLIRDGLTPQAFESTRNFLSKYVNLVTKTASSELGYAIDSKVYGIPDYATYIRTALAKLKVEDVNRAIRKHLRADRLEIVAITDNGSDFAKTLLANEPSPMKYNSPKPDALLAEDKIVENLKLNVQPENVEVIPAAKVFE